MGEAKAIGGTDGCGTAEYEVNLGTRSFLSVIYAPYTHNNQKCITMAKMEKKTTEHRVESNTDATKRSLPLSTSRVKIREKTTLIKDIYARGFQLGRSSSAQRRQ